MEYDISLFGNGSVYFIRLLNFRSYYFRGKKNNQNLLSIYPVEAEVLPSPHEILFCTDLEEGRSYMVWSYQEARVVTSIYITPVPFNLPQEVDIQFIDESLKVRSKVTHTLTSQICLFLDHN